MSVFTQLISSHYQLNSTIFATGVTLNALCIACLATVVRKIALEEKNDRNGTGGTSSGSMYKYLLVKAVCDMFYYIFYAFTELYLTCAGAKTCANTIAGTYSFAFFQTWFPTVGIYGLSELSSLLEVIATLDCLLTIKQKCTFALTKMAFWAITAGLVLLTLALQAYKFPSHYVKTKVYSLEVNITNVSTLVHKNYTYYAFGDTSFYNTDTYAVINLVDTYLIRDIVCLIMIFILNVFILWEIKKLTKRRITLAGFGNNHAPQTEADLAELRANQSVSIALKAERRKTIMISLTGLNFILGHVLFPITVALIYFDLAYVLEPGPLVFYYISTYLSYLSYATSFFFYYFFNSHFKKTANSIGKFACYPIVVAFRHLRR